MGFYRKVNYFLVHTLMLSNRQAAELIRNGLVEIDGSAIYGNCVLEEHSEVKVSGIVRRPKKAFVYLKFYKPAGYESTLNPGIADNLSPFFSEYTGLAIAGRLDKHSEGLLLLSNNGKWVEQLCNPKFEKEKEYLVTLDREPDEPFAEAFRAGVRIGRYTTAPCSCERLGHTHIRVILTEGKNRQIRRMCKTLGYAVRRLQRIRIDHITLDSLQPGEKSTFEV